MPPLCLSRWRGTSFCASFQYPLFVQVCISITFSSSTVNRVSVRESLNNENFRAIAVTSCTLSCVAAAMSAFRDCEYTLLKKSRNTDVRNSTFMRLTVAASDSRSGTKSGPSYSWHLDMAVMMRSFIVRCW